MKFVGVDLAWTPRGGTGLCVAEHGRVIDSALLGSDDDVLGWMRPHTEGPVLLAVDAPLIVANASGARPCERMISRCFGAYGASAHSSNLGRPAFTAGVRGGVLMAALGLDVDPAFVPATRVRRAIEVYPHPAIVALFARSEILKYKSKGGRTVASRSGAFVELTKSLESLKQASPSLDVTAAPRWAVLRDTVATPRSGAELDRVEDELDAYLCAYIALYFWTHGSTRCRIVGDLTTGYIVTPVNEAQARCLDAQQMQLGVA